MTTQLYSIRPGRRADIPVACDLYVAAFHGEGLLDILFPAHKRHPEALAAHLHRLFTQRHWSIQYQLAVCIPNATAAESGSGPGSGSGSGGGKPVGCTWWKRPASQISFYERWISPYTWFSRIVLSVLSLRDRLFPIPHIEPHAAATFDRVFADIQPVIMNSDRRREAWYLSTLCVEPRLQGKGLGSMLLQYGLREVDSHGAAAWLIGLAGLDAFYGRYGFAEVARANVGELAGWDGGLIMFRE